MFSCKDIFGDVPKALPVKEIKAIQDTFNFLEPGILLYLRSVLFLSPPEYSPLFGSGYARLGRNLF